MSKVAVCIASYNFGMFLPDLLDGLTRQTFEDFVVYIVYDGSGDNTLEVIERYREKLSIVVADYEHVARVGLNKNKVVTRALQDKPDYIQMVDADDKVLPRFLEAGVERLDRGDVDWVICWGRLFGTRTGYIHSEVPTLGELLRNNDKLHSWGLFKRELLEEHNFAKSLTSGADWQLWIDLVKAGAKGAIVEKELYLKRWHEDSVTAIDRKSHREIRAEVLTATGFADQVGKFRFHLPGLVHLPVSERYMGCAFTQKIVKLSKMLLSLGHEVYLYGAEGSDAPCTEFVQTHTLRDIRREWGEGDNRFDIGYDWKRNGFKHDFNTQRTETTQEYYKVCAYSIDERKQPDDFLLIMQGVYQKPIADAVKLWLTCEPGIGYRGSFARYRAFESASLQNFTYGSQNPGQCINGHYYDRVIPNYFDAEDFPFREEKEDWFFYIGRMISRKGVWTAIKATEAIGAKLILAGQTSPEIDVKKLPPHCEFIGYVGPEKRADLMGRAKAVFIPTLYLEAFGGTNVEAQLCGTPAITTNFGVFPETVVHGVTGFRCNTLQDFVTAARDTSKLDPHAIRKHAECYLMDNVKHEFQAWFSDLYQLYLSAHNPDTKGWHHYE